MYSVIIIITHTHWSLNECSVIGRLGLICRQP